jgi:hypothetical protein
MPTGVPMCELKVSDKLEANDGCMVSSRLRATFLSKYRELQAGGNASKYY